MADVPLGIFEFEIPFSPAGSGDSFDWEADAALGIYRLLAGTSTEFVAIWAEPDASQTNGRFQASSTGTGAGLSVVDLASKTLYDYYTTTASGRANEALESDNIIDLVTV